MQHQQSGPGRRSLYLRRKMASSRRRRRRLLVMGLLTAFCLLAAGSLYIWKAPASEPETVEIVMGKAEIALETEALIVQQERVYTAPAGGKVERLVEEGERIRAGAPVVRINGKEKAAQPSQPTEASRDRKELQEVIDQLSNEIYNLAFQVSAARAQGDPAQVERLQAQLDKAVQRQFTLNQQLGQSEAEPIPAGEEGAAVVTSDLAGVVLYRVDGFEAELNPVNASKWTPSWFHALKASGSQRSNEEVAAGEPLFKVVDNLSQGLAMLVPADQLPLALPDHKLQIRPHTQKEAVITGRLLHVQREADEALLYVTTPFVPREWAGVRRVRVTLILAGHKGKVLPRSAIDVQDGRQGVWELKQGTPVFVPVKVVGGNERNVVVETELSPGARVLRFIPPQEG